MSALEMLSVEVFGPFLRQNAVRCDLPTVRAVVVQDDGWLAMNLGQNQRRAIMTGQEDE